MKQTINLSAFRDAFQSMGRYDQFGYEALEVLFDYLEEIDEDMELDVIALCCEYAHGTIDEIARDYNINLSGSFDEDDDESRTVVREWLEDRTTVCGETTEGFVYCTAF